MENLRLMQLTVAHLVKTFTSATSKNLGKDMQQIPYAGVGGIQIPPVVLSPWLKKWPSLKWNDIFTCIVGFRRSQILFTILSQYKNRTKINLTNNLFMYIL